MEMLTFTCCDSPATTVGSGVGTVNDKASAGQLPDATAAGEMDWIVCDPFPVLVIVTAAV
jgi:hypothetical protein